jgi:hypothetical protein
MLTGKPSPLILAGFFHPIDNQNLHRAPRAH